MVVLGVALAVVSGATACTAWSRAGSSLWVGQVCHGIPHGHLHKRTNSERRQLLHHTRLSKFMVLKAGFLLDNLCGHLGHCRRRLQGSDRVLGGGGVLMVGRVWVPPVVCGVAKSLAVVELGSPRGRLVAGISQVAVALPALAEGGLLSAWLPPSGVMHVGGGVVVGGSGVLGLGSVEWV